MGSHRLAVDLNSLALFLNIHPFSNETTIDLIKYNKKLPAINMSNNKSYIETKQETQIDNKNNIIANLWNKIYGKLSVLPISSLVKHSWLVQIFSPITLRRTKQMVANQLQLKDKIFIIRNIQFSHFEQALYKEREIQIKNKAATLNDHSDFCDINNNIEKLRKGIDYCLFYLFLFYNVYLTYAILF